MYHRFAFPARIRALLALSGNCFATEKLPPITTICVVAIIAAAQLCSPARADIIYGTSNSNIVSYNTKTLATTTTPTNLNQPYGIAYGPDGNLYIVDRIPNVNLQKVEKYSTGGSGRGLI